ncbi:MAG TPA: GlsB/YeaQ/YmgE family stress response membrane protein [Chloroflexota bacterium]|nr:GlsB/YeaQ/YmgE family stress response membrane protein [Chloroflexota bacterium]
MIAGWLAGVVMKGGGFGLVGDIVVGIIGAFIGGLLLPRLGLGLPAGFLGSIVVAFVGAVILLLVLRLVGGGGSRKRA